MTDLHAGDRLAHPRPTLADWLGLCVVLAYGAAFIQRTSFVIDGERYFSLFDDAMISMRYAQNLAAGHGMVWNPGGPRVEGFTNPLWVLYMAIWHLLPIADSKLSFPLQITGLATLAGTCWLTRSLTFSVTDSPTAARAALLLTGLYLPLVNWSLQGMEVGVLALLLTAAASMAVRASPPSRWLWVLLGVGVWVRVDFAVPAAILLAGAIWIFRAQRRSVLIWGGSLLLSSLALQTLLRWLYFGELVPNTYLLKLTGVALDVRLHQGVHSLVGFLRGSGWVPLLAPGALLLFRRERGVAVLACLVGGQLAYSVYVGGDAWEEWGGANRYIAPAMPCLFVLISALINELHLPVARRLKAKKSSLWLAGGLRWARSLALLARMNASVGKDPPFDWLLQREPLYVSENRQMVQLARDIREGADEGASVALIWSGAAAYFAQRQAIDMLGKSDKVIARGPSRPSNHRAAYPYFHPGHDKWDYGYSIETLKPDLVPQLHFLGEDYSPPGYVGVRMGRFLMYARKDSSHVHWKSVEILDVQPAFLSCCRGPRRLR